MKKLVLFAVATVVISFASCGGNKAQEEAEQKRIQDSIDAVAAIATADADAKLEAASDSIVLATDSLVQEVVK